VEDVRELEVQQAYKTTYSQLRQNNKAAESSGAGEGRPDWAWTVSQPSVV